MPFFLFIMASLKDIENTLIEHYGEDRVDVSSGYIMIYYPEVRVTNEYDRYIDITKLYVKIPMCSNGTMLGTFKMNRSEYTKDQYECNYMHSHISDIPTNYVDFKDPCLGTGPLRDTISSLNREIDLDLWRLFCVELDMFVRTESLAGIPYRRLENVGQCNANFRYYLPEIRPLYSVAGQNNMSEEESASILHPFIKYLIEKDLVFVYNSGLIKLGYSDTKLAIIISNYFIEYFNSQSSTFRKENMDKCIKFLRKCTMKDEKLYLSHNRVPFITISNIPLWHFKGEQIYLNIIDNSDEADNSMLILSPITVSYIKSIILKTLNTYYGKTGINKAAYIL